MAVPTYTYMVHDLLTNNPLGELPLTGVEFTKKANDSGTLRGSFTVQPRSLPDRLVRDPYDLTMPCRRAIYAYRDDRPMWGGIIWTRRYDSSSRVVELGAGDWWSYFDHRRVVPLLTKPVNPAYDVAELVLTYSGVEQNQIARNLVALAQSHTGGNLGIVFDDSAALIPRDRMYRGYELSSTGEMLRQLANVLDGSDMMFDTAADPNGRPVRLFRQGAPYLGQQGSPWVWEYGANLSSYTWPSDGTRYASRVFTTGEGTVEGTLIAVSEDTDPYTHGFPLIEAETSYTTVSNPGTLQQHADADQFSARLPVVLPELTIRGDMDPIVGAWGIGDDARVLIEDDFVPSGIDTSLRIVGSSIAPGEDQEVVRLTVAPLLDDVA
ncbi:hypothetical protein [Amycolatopsis sp. H20-H5]|uniref:hypothetical protein n=1 Tax=Amycolatopsis sp. H20-H5 TaxID=3046309 RepID=UPI002DBDC69C|nr:hypothetical protein [Amycolatopsis sp. H20-H5]MEC3977911.1 hypothetical protein [Amycolatopsis sp. H20-H5]